MKRIVTFGEIMGRLAPPGFLRFRQALPGSLDVTFAGAEANVAASLAMLGVNADFVTALPDHDIADACIGSVRNMGVGTDHIVRGDGRLGLYFLETGANQRPSRVTYDRAGSSISVTPSSAYNWNETLKGATWFHTTGITPAISQVAFESALDAARIAKAQGSTVSCDLNFRKKLWRWDPSCEPRELAGETMRQLLPYVDVVIANEEDCHDVLGIQAEDSDVESGSLNVSRYPDVARKVVQQFPNVSRVAITLRESISASHNNWGGMLFDAATDTAFFAPVGANGEYAPYEIRNIVDRVGGGDSFGAGLIFASTTDELSDPESSIRFAVAASCLAHSISGDFNFSTRAEVEALMKGSGSGRVVR
ncbi:MAG: sugar kinase [Planctomycetales bacterium]|nr:sugar kinase [Planctomycetales bacterium]